MGFTVRFLLGTVLVLLCFWLVEPAFIHRSIREINNETQKIEKENTTESVVANLNSQENQPKTEFSTEDNATIDKQNSVVGQIEKSESYKVATQAENGRAIDIEKYVSKEFHNKNNVYKFPNSPDNEKFIDPDFELHSTTHKHEFSEPFDYHAELTTPKTSLFDQKYKEAVESVDQKLEHIDDDHEVSSESESKENINLEKLYEETKKNDTKADLNYINYKNIIKNDTDSKNTVHKDLVVEAGTNLDFRSSFNKTTVIDEDDSGNNTIIKEPEEKKVEITTLSNVILAKGDLDHAESSTGKSMIFTTRKNIFLTKPPSTSNSSHISILSNNIETETVKAINYVISTTEKQKGETESVLEVISEKTPIEIIKKPITLINTPTTESLIETNHINRTSEQIFQENQVVPIHVEPPPVLKNNTTESPNKVNQKMQVPPKKVVSVKNQSTETITSQLISTAPSVVTENSAIEVLLTSSKTTENPVTENVVITKQTTVSLLQSDATTTIPETTTQWTENVPFTELVRIETQTSVYTGAETTTILTTEADITTVSTNILEKTTENLPQQNETENTTRITEPETITSIITETSVSPWERATTQAATIETKTYSTINEIETSTIPITESTTIKEIETTTFTSNYLSDGTAASTVLTTENPEDSTTTEINLTTEITNVLNNETTQNNLTTESSVRTSKEMVYKELTTSTVTATEATITEASNSESEISVKLSTIRIVPETITPEVLTVTTVNNNIEAETTTVAVNPIAHPDLKHIEQTDSSTEVENTTDNNTITSDFYEHTDSPEDNSGTIAAITISSIGAVCLILLAGLLVIMRKRQKRFNYGQRCTPVSLDDYSMDNVSVYNSVRRKGMLRGSKRSYGNPAFEDPVCVSHPLNFPALGKFASNLEDIKAEFEDIPQITARTNELPEGCDTKNRYANVIPLPETRVFLTLIEGYPNSDYINANYVTGPKNTKGYYIACQAPLQNTVDDFWRMIWEQQCKVILMLTHLFENGIEKCVDYLPPSEVLDCHRLFGDFQVTLKKREVKDKYIISSLQLKNMVSNSWREVTHFWYLGWPEKGIPTEANSLIAFLIEARSYMKSSSLDRKDITNGNVTNGMTKNELNPVVVHCSPGTGRTGVVIACDIAIREFEQTRLVDVPRIVYKIRRDRASAVQTKEQYTFIYKVINLYATKLTGGALDSL